jgi:hypothetical protein
MSASQGRLGTRETWNKGDLEQGRLGTRQPAEGDLRLAGHRRSGGGEAPRGRDDVEFAGSEPGDRASEGQQELLVALINLPADLPVRRVE